MPVLRPEFSVYRLLLEKKWDHISGPSSWCRQTAFEKMCHFSGPSLEDFLVDVKMMSFCEMCSVSKLSLENCAIFLVHILAILNTCAIILFLCYDQCVPRSAMFGKLAVIRGGSWCWNNVSWYEEADSSPVRMPWFVCKRTDSVSFIRRSRKWV